MFDFWKFYNGLFNRSDIIFDGYWDKFPVFGSLKYKTETLSLLKQNIKNKNVEGLIHTLAVIYADGADKDYTNDLLFLLEENWHLLTENIIEILEIIKDPNTVNKVYEIAINIPDYDEMRAIAIKCMRVLTAVNSRESINKLKLLAKFNDKIISEYAILDLEKIDF